MPITDSDDITRNTNHNINIFGVARDSSFQVIYQQTISKFLKSFL